MCGRYNLITDPRAWVDALDIVIDSLEQGEWQARYNIAPSQPVPVIRSTERGRELIAMRWGLIPHWVREDKPRHTPINARTDSMHKAFFRDPFKRHRCLIPADGFYEWQKRKGAKQPWHIHLEGGGPFLFAGLWDRWAGPNGEVLSFTILTREADETLKPLHSRMPLILPETAYAPWLEGDPASAERWLDSFTDRPLTCEPISTRVNSPANDDPGLLEPIEA